MARIIARFTPDQLRAVIEAGDFTERRHDDLLLRILVARQRRILRRYLARISPIGQLEVQRDALCGIDFARRTRVFHDAQFRYAANARIVDDRASFPRPVSAKPDGSFCIPLDENGGPPRSENGRPSYWVVTLTNGQAPGELRAFLYDLGKERGFRLVGVERPEL